MILDSIPTPYFCNMKHMLSIQTGDYAKKDIIWCHTRLLLFTTCDWEFLQSLNYLFWFQKRFCFFCSAASLEYTKTSHSSQIMHKNWWCAYTYKRMKWWWYIYKTVCAASTDNSIVCQCFFLIRHIVSFLYCIQYIFAFKKWQQLIMIVLCQTNLYV